MYTTFVVSGNDVTSAWRAACAALDRRDNPQRVGFHTVVRIADATVDDLVFRTHLDQVRFAAQSSYPIETIANTIFPAALAVRCDTHEELTRRYRAMYQRTKRYPGNRFGTYFGRLVSYPGAKATEFDQLGNIISRLRQQAASRGPMTAAYEADIAHTQDGLPPTQPSEGPLDALVHAAGQDNSVRGFPCLSHCSFQLDRAGVLHATALYRIHYMLDRAYGNYLGLGRLTSYIASQANLRYGTLTVVAGYTHLEGPISRIRPLLGGVPQLF